MLFLNEVKFLIRQPSAITVSFLSLILGIMFGASIQAEDTNQQHLFQIYSLQQMLILPLLLAVLVTKVFLRDENTQMAELIRCTPLSHLKRTALRFGSVYTFASLPMFISYFVASLVLNDGAYGASSLLVGYFVFFAPNLLLMSVLIIGFAQYSKSNFAVYTFSAFFGVGYLVLGSVLGFPFLSGSSVASESLYTAMLWIDPLGITALLHFSSEGSLLANTEVIVNRILILTFSCLVLFQILHSTRKEVPSKADAKTPTTQSPTLAWSKTPQNKVASITMTLTVSTLKSKVNQTILLIWLGIVFNEVLSGLSGLKSAGGHEISSLDAINFVAMDLMLGFGTAMAAMWSWLICWREKQLDFSEIISSAPVSNNTRLLSQCMSMWVLHLLLVLLTALSTLIAQIAMDTQVTAVQYLTQFSVASIPLLILSAGFVFIHNIVHSPAKAGFILCAVLFVKFTPITSSVGMTSLLWNIAGSPIQEASHFWGFEGSRSVLIPFGAFWMMFTITLYAFAKKLTHRGTGFAQSGAPSRLIKPMTLLFTTLIAGLLLNNQLRSEKPLTYKNELTQWQVDYEKNYKSWLTKAQPTLLHIDSKVDLYPEAGAANIDLKYTLSNESSESITELLLGRHGNYKDWSVREDNDFTVVSDDDSQQKLIKLRQPLRPGQKMKIGIRINYQQPVLWPVNANVVVKEAFTNILANNFLPVVGYQTKFELKEASLRAENALNDDVHTVSEQPKVTFSTVISTKVGHTVLSQGQLVQQWSLKGREYFKFKSDRPASIDFVWVSVPDTSHRDVQQSPLLEVYTPSSYDKHTEIVEVISDLSTALQTHLNIQSTDKLTIVSTPKFTDLTYATSDVILFDFDNLLKNVSYQNPNLIYIYHHLVSAMVDRFLLTATLTSEPLIIELLKGQALLALADKTFGADARQVIVNEATRKYKLLTITQLNNDVHYFSEEPNQKASVRAVLMIQALEALLGKEHVRQALSDHLRDTHGVSHEQFLALLKRNQPESIGNKIDRVFSSDALKLTPSF